MGEPYALEIDPGLLLSELRVSDLHWTIDNLDRIILQYHDATGIQHHALEYSPSVTTAELDVSNSVFVNTWQLHSVILTDKDGWEYVITRDQLSDTYDIAIEAQTLTINCGTFLEFAEGATRTFDCGLFTDHTPPTTIIDCGTF